MRMAYHLGLAVLLGLHTVAAWAQTAEELRAIYFRNDISRMEEIANTGDVRAEAWMGVMLQNRGRRSEAKEWSRRAAEKGNRWAINRLANMHRADRKKTKRRHAGSAVEPRPVIQTPCTNTHFSYCMAAVLRRMSRQLRAGTTN